MLSGFAALLYQVIWQRVLVIFSGADVFSATVVVASFMAGLGAGSLLGGYVADRIGARRSLLAFAAAELFIGVFGAVSKPLYYDVLYHRFSYLAATPLVAALVLFGSLLIPTFAMGLSLPLLARGLTMSLKAAPHTVGTLYGVNTLGAAVGAFVATWMLVPRFGLEHSLWIAVATNGLCATLALRLARRTSSPGDERLTIEDDDELVAKSDRGLPFGLWVLIYGLTGFIALGLEITWFRLLGVLVKSTSFTFGTLLAVYLFGLGAGAALGARLAGASRRAGITFVLLQIGVALYAAASTIGLISAISAGRPIKLVRFLGSYDPVDVYATFRHVGASWRDAEAFGVVFDFAVLYLVMPAVLIGPATLMMGMSFPFLQKAAQADFSRFGRRLGVLLATNIAGGVIGAVAVGYLLLPQMGSADTLKALIGISMLLALPLVRLTNGRRRWAPVGYPLMVVMAIGLAIVALPNGPTLWASLHASTPSMTLFDEDGAGLSLIKIDRSTAAGEVYVNGLGQSWLPYGNIHTALGALPAFVHPAPVDVAIIGLGSGDTAFAAAGRPEIQRLVSIEILGAQRQTLERFGQLFHYPGLLAILSDPRIEHRIGDGRAFILHSGRRFDIIEADALRPSSAYAGHLYSVEYFELLRRHLKPGGFAVSWGPTRRIQATFRSVFPYVRIFVGDICVGSNQPITVDRSVVLSRVMNARDYYAAAGIDIVALLQPYLESAAEAVGPDAPVATDLNTDLFPRDEFALPF